MFTLVGCILKVCRLFYLFAAGDIKSEEIKSEKGADGSSTAVVVKSETSNTTAHSNTESGQRGIKREANTGSLPSRIQQDSKKTKTS